MLLGSRRPTLSALAVVTLVAMATLVPAPPGGGGGAARAATPSRAKGARPVRLVTFNVNKNLDSGHAHDWGLLKKKADIVFLQETSRLRVRTLVGAGTWAVRQGPSGSKESEVALAVRRGVLRGGSGSSVSGFRVVRVLRHRGCGTGAGVGSRFVATALVELTNGRVLRVASTHLPPHRCWGTPYDTEMSHLRSWAAGTDHRTGLVIGADWNKSVARDPGGFPGLEPHGVGIDGFQVSSHLTVSAGAHRLHGDYLSDHVPVEMTITH